MQVEIYADVVFLINLVMDFFIFWITGKLCRKKTPVLRLFLGSLAAALIYCATLFFPPINQTFNIAFALFLLTGSVFLIYKPKKINELIKYTVIALITSFALGGAGIALFYLTNIGATIGSLVGFTVQHLSLKILLASIGFFYIVIKLFSNIITSAAMNKQTFYTIQIHLNGKSADVRALVDTGNTLCEPVSGLPVIVTEFNSIKELLPDQFKLLFYEKKEDDLAAMLSCLEGTEMAGRIRMIPFSSLGTKHGMLIGFRPDKVDILIENTLKPDKEAIVGIYNASLGNQYNALLNPEI